MPLLALLLPGFLAVQAGMLLPGHSCPTPTDAVEVDVVTVTISGGRAPVVVLKERDSSRALPIVIGPYEADAIWSKLSNRSYPRPLTHDLLRNALESSGITMRQAVIWGERDGVYLAFLTLKRGGRCVRVDSRPSDAIALALRCGAPVLVSRRLMASNSAFDMGDNPSPVRLQGVTLQRLTPGLAERLGVKSTRGALVADVRKGRFARVLERGDVIIEIDGRSVEGLVEAMQRMQALDPAAPARIRVLRGGKTLDLEAPGGN